VNLFLRCRLTENQRWTGRQAEKDRRIKEG
jgi:hypothetical protein